LLVEYSEHGLTEALEDGRLIINFTVMKCVRYQPDKFKRLLYYEKHPKPPKKASTSKGSSSKKPAQKQKRRRNQAPDSDTESAEESVASESRDVGMTTRKRKGHGNEKPSPAKRLRDGPDRPIKKEGKANDCKSDSEYVEDSELEDN
jgi:hypothetical protein